MPVVARVDDVKIMLYWDDHPPAHFHVEFGQYRAQIAIESLSVTNGYIPKSQYRKVLAWAELRKNELLEAWIRCQSDLHPGKIR